MPLIRVELLDHQTASELRDQIDRAVEMEDPRAAVKELGIALRTLVDHIAHIEYIGEDE